MQAGGPRRVNCEQRIRLGRRFNAPDILPPERAAGAGNKADVLAPAGQFYEALDDGRFDPLHIERPVRAVECGAHGIAT